MDVFFGQVYIEPGVAFPFSHHFQRRISATTTALVKPSQTFVKKFGKDSDLFFNVSAKTAIEDNEIHGPARFRGSKWVEYTVFLPFDAISRSPNVPQTALRFLFRGVYSVMRSLGIDITELVADEASIIEQICADPTSFESEDDVDV